MRRQCGKGLSEWSWGVVRALPVCSAAIAVIGLISLIPDSYAFTRKAPTEDQAAQQTSAINPRLDGRKAVQALIQPSLDPDIRKICEDINLKVKVYNWKLKPCDPGDWRIGGWSVQGRPLVWAEFGDSSAENTTLILSMIHGDEITPMFVGLKLVEWLKENIHKYPSTRIVLAPLVNPDGFFKRRPTRTNANGVDVNRNFPTDDWDEEAIRKWKTRYSAIPRRFPGKTPGSEPETRFQQEMIEKFKPKKVLSVHAPLNFMDYDGPNMLTLKQFPKEYVQKCLELRKQLKAVHGGFFPGSLGNYAGQERGIPTLTLELPSANPGNAEKYWKEFKTGITTVIGFEVPDFVSLQEQERREKEQERRSSRNSVERTGGSSKGDAAGKDSGGASGGGPT